MSLDSFHIEARDVTPEEVATLIDTRALVRLDPADDDFEDRGGVYDVGCISRHKTADKGNIGMRLVPGNASGEERYTTNRPAANLTPAELVERNEGQRNSGIYLPIEVVLAALEADSVEDLLRDTTYAPMASDEAASAD